MDLDKDVIARAVRRDKDAFAEIYNALSPQVFRYIYYLVGDRQEADDLTSDVFLRAWQAIDRYEDRGISISSWLLRISHNASLRHLKRNKPRVSLDDIDLRADERHSPDVVFALTSEAQMVRRAILTLPDVQRQIIICRFIEHMSHAQVEAIIGKSSGAVRVLQHRALKRLREELKTLSQPAPVSVKQRVAKAGA